jgi:hypothetical protein
MILRNKKIICFLLPVALGTLLWLLARQHEISFQLDSTAQKNLFEQSWAEPGTSLKLPNSKQETEPSAHYWYRYPNNADTYGTNIAETGPREFLNGSQSILQKALKNSEDLDKLKVLFSNPANYQNIAEHYENLPHTFYFIEEATRIKMLNFLIASLEFGSAPQAEGEAAVEAKAKALSLASKIAGLNVRDITDRGLAQSIAGDIIRILAALRKYAPDAYAELKTILNEQDINTKLLVHFEQSNPGH